MTQRKALPQATALTVLTEAGYRCAVPTCRTILALDLHHMVEVSEGGTNDPANLVALCPTCHALFHRGRIARESISLWKGMLVTLSQAFDAHAIDDLLFLYKLPENQLLVSGDGVLKFSRLIAADLAGFQLAMQNGPMLLYRIGVTNRGPLWFKRGSGVTERL
jgi:hypothetical protein